MLIKLWNNIISYLEIDGELETIRNIKLPSEKSSTKCFQPIENYYSFKQRFDCSQELGKGLFERITYSLLALIVKSEITKPYLN